MSIDKKWFRLDCADCGQTDLLCATDKGSGWGGSSWRDINASDKFEFVQKDRDTGEPDMISATCNSCKSAASLKDTYCMGTPKDF